MPKRAQELAATVGPTGDWSWHHAGPARTRRLTATRFSTATCAARSIAPSGVCELTISAPDTPQPTHARGRSSPPATSRGRFARSASWTMRCCGCGSTSRRSARSCCARLAIPQAVLDVDAALDAGQDHWLVREIIGQIRRTLKRARSHGAQHLRADRAGQRLCRARFRAGAGRRSLLHARSSRRGTTRFACRR